MRTPVDGVGPVEPVEVNSSDEAVEALVEEAARREFEQFRAAQPEGMPSAVWGEVSERVRRSRRNQIRDTVEFVAARVHAEAVAEERQRIADAILPDHWQTSEIWGGVLRAACGRCRHGDGVRFLWPCPTRRAITGEPEPDPDSSRLAAAAALLAALRDGA